MDNNFDSGGAVAIRGFNYQKAVIAYIAICNIDENDFYIIPENSEDIEVMKNGKVAHIQVKGSKMGLTGLLKEGSFKKPKPSIISKLIKKDCGDKFKIATTNNFVSKDFKHLIEVPGEFCENGIYQLSDGQKDIIREELKKTGRFTDDFINNRVQQIYVMISIFANDINSATMSLLGLMTQKKIKVDDDYGSRSLSELFTQIEQKSEITYKAPDDPMLERKTIFSRDLDKIFNSVLNEDKVKSIRAMLLEDCEFDASTQKKIERYFMRIKVTNRSDLFEIKGKLIDKDRDGKIDFALFFEPSLVKNLIDSLYKDLFTTVQDSLDYSLLLQALAEMSVTKGYGS